MYYKTSEIARAVGVHPNTVRLYEQWGLLPPIPRSANGYRLFSDLHLEQMHLARIALRCQYVEGKIRQMATNIVKTAARGQLGEALSGAERYLVHIQHELTRAMEAQTLVQKWLTGEMKEPPAKYIKRSDAANFLNVSIDVLRNWERNGLVQVHRDPVNNYRLYGTEELNRLKVIRTLRVANYSIMSIYRMMRYIDRGGKDGAADLLDSPHPEEDIVSATDRWISTLRETSGDARELIGQLQRMIKKFQ